MIDWRHWHNEPWLIGGLVALGWLWAIFAGPLRGCLAPAEAYPRREAYRFYGALLIFYFAVGSPLDQLGERFLFSAHMFQHQLLIYPAAILFLRGLPAWMTDALVDRPGIRIVVRILTHPVCAPLVFALTIGLWHAPLLYEAALRNKLLHVAEHVTFFLAALLFWWPLASTSRALKPLAYGPQMLYLLGGTILMTPVFAFITFSHDVLYDTYAFAPRIIPNFSAADDQLLAGASMQLVGVIVAMSAFGHSFYRWFQAGERRASSAAPARG